MMQLTDEQLNNLDKEALVIIASSLQSQLGFMQEQLNTANDNWRTQTVRLNFLLNRLEL